MDSATALEMLVPLTFVGAALGITLLGIRRAVNRAARIARSLNRDEVYCPSECNVPGGDSLECDGLNGMHCLCPCHKKESGSP